MKKKMLVVKQIECADENDKTTKAHYKWSSSYAKNSLSSSAYWIGLLTTFSCTHKRTHTLPYNPIKFSIIYRFRLRISLHTTRTFIKYLNTFTTTFPIQLNYREFEVESFLNIDTRSTTDIKMSSNVSKLFSNRLLGEKKTLEKHMHVFARISG